MSQTEAEAEATCGNIHPRPGEERDLETKEVSAMRSSSRSSSSSNSTELQKAIAEVEAASEHFDACARALDHASVRLQMAENRRSQAERGVFSNHLLGDLPPLEKQHYLKIRQLKEKEDHYRNCREDYKRGMRSEHDILLAQIELLKAYEGLFHGSF